MNNPKMDLEVWKQLKKKWTNLDASGHRLKIDFQLVTDPSDANRVMAIDVVQHINGKPVVETVERCPGEAYPVLGIDGLSLEQLVEVFKDMMQELRSQCEQCEVDVIVTMAPTSPASAELSGLLVAPGGLAQGPVRVNYRHYYVLNALRDRMVETLGERWSQVRAVYHAGELDFQFTYS